MVLVNHGTQLGKPMPKVGERFETFNDLCRSVYRTVQVW